MYRSGIETSRSAVIAREQPFCPKQSRTNFAIKNNCWCASNYILHLQYKKVLLGFTQPTFLSHPVSNKLPLGHLVTWSLKNPLCIAFNFRFREINSVIIIAVQSFANIAYYQTGFVCYNIFRLDCGFC